MSKQQPFILIDDEILQKTNTNQLWLLLHLAKRINKDSFCQVSNASLLKDTKWACPEKLQRIKKELVELELIQIEPQLCDAGQSANIYRIITDKIKN